ncbi:hypothetical protein M758_11G009900 [Ceratodon purpureus]|nr:hypothetical protein M758_11G009900 [Ceratodon purpureus]
MASSALLRACCTPATAAVSGVSQPPRTCNGNARLSQLSWSGCVAGPLLNSAVRVSRRQERVGGGVVAMVLPVGDVAVDAPKVNWEARAVKSFSMGELEARKLKYPNTGTESLLLGILTEGTSEAARYLRRNGVTLFGAKEEIIKLLGKADMYFFSPEHPPLTSSAQKALAFAADPKNIPGNFILVFLLKLFSYANQMELWVSADIGGLGFRFGHSGWGGRSLDIFFGIYIKPHMKSRNWFP